MTDKQIIIDGVDVSGCEFATKAEMACDTHCRLYDYKYCIGKDCYYKQLKAKEQECEELKRQLEVKGNILKLTDEAKNEYLKENQKLKQTLTEIKEIAEEKANVNDWLALEILQKISECEVE